MRIKVTHCVLIGLLPPLYQLDLPLADGRGEGHAKGHPDLLGQGLLGLWLRRAPLVHVDLNHMCRFVVMRSPPLAFAFLLNNQDALPL